MSPGFRCLILKQSGHSTHVEAIEGKASPELEAASSPAHPSSEAVDHPSPSLFPSVVTATPPEPSLACAELVASLASAPGPDAVASSYHMHIDQ